MSRVFPGFQDVRWLLASHSALYTSPMFVHTNLQNVGNPLPQQKNKNKKQKQKQQLELANWLKEQCKCEAVLRSEGTQKLGVVPLCHPVSTPCWHHVLLQKMGFTQNKENMAMVAPELHSWRKLSTKKVKLLYHVQLEKCLHGYEAVNTGLCLLFCWPSCIYFSRFYNICSLALKELKSVQFSSSSALSRV